MNQREIKFKAWDKKEKKMYSVKCLSYEGDNKMYLTLYGTNEFNRMIDNFILMQFTGLKDKNGKEIYEGDIVKAPAMEENAICEVVWDMNGWIIKSKEGLTGLTNYGGKFAPEVIGNIYENPELLKVEKN